MLVLINSKISEFSKQHVIESHGNKPLTKTETSLGTHFRVTMHQYSFSYVHFGFLIEKIATVWLQLPQQTIRLTPMESQLDAVVCENRETTAMEEKQQLLTSVQTQRRKS